MARDCCGVGPGRRRAGWAVIPVAVLAVLPKCPLCLAAYLSAAGISAGLAAPALQLMRPACVVAALAIVALAVRRGRRARPAG
jgi:hypothetical protein